MTTLADTARAAFRAAFAADIAGVAFAPGRVNLIGEHTDYNEGFVLPLALHLGVAAAFRARSDGRLRARSMSVAGEVDLPMADLGPGRPEGWGAYLAGTAWALREAGHDIGGADLLLASDLPLGAGLSSSAALELAVARALAGAWSVPWDPVAMAAAARRAENDYVGVACGVMDQLAAALGRPEAGLLIDCRSLEVRPVPLRPDLDVLVLDTGVRRALSAGEFNRRVESCRTAVAVIARDHPEVSALRDVDAGLLASYEGSLDPVTFRRASHVVREVGRPAAFAAALEAGDAAEAGRLMAASHRSLRDLYEVSSPELDALVQAASAHEGCLGARLTGAGLGGCAVALVRGEASDDVARSALAAYRARFDHPASAFTARGAEGARLLV